ncbi:hypothetical protein C2L64_52020 [Paraburkholderia hospita]|uniref:Uncharacterized protein n=1 Tax=Paraburkholderia hospita TaxID=169430 RepID=A0AAN1JM91_9BURK|nr:hypothetical protein C2L64_52020 [Paraburkholderia hospita]OUL83808.1 hypothetical protein CA603_25800 [Paraburkholderia hospita]
MKSSPASIAAVVLHAVSTAVGPYQIGVTAVNDVKRIIGAVSTLAGNFVRLFGGGNSGTRAATRRCNRPRRLLNCCQHRQRRVHRS